MGFQIDWDLTAVWAQAIANTVVLFMIYGQIKQTNSELVQNDVQERFRRSWEFVKLYRDELRQDELELLDAKDTFDPELAETNSPTFELFIRHFLKPRQHLFILLNKLVEHQEVDERLLFGYLEDDFNLFVTLGIRLYGVDEFKKRVGSRIKLLLTLWGSSIKATKLLYGTGQHAKFQGA